MLRSSLKTFVVLAAAMLCGCQHVCPSRGKIEHVVVVWQKDHGNIEAQQKLIDLTYELGKLPGITRVSAGRALPSTRPVVDSSYDIAFVMTFKDEASLHAYETNPTHVKAVNEIIKPMAEKIVVYDIRK